MSELPLPLANRCSSCDTELATTLLVCPACHALVHRERLTMLARDAEAEKNRDKAIALWREALALLPPGSKQHDAIAKKLDELTNAASYAEPLFDKLISPVTLISMLVSLGVYASASSVPVAATVIGAIFIHEMGHLVELRKRRMAADPPVFIPGLGAFVPMRTRPATPSDDAQIGLAGPLWGLGASVAALLAYLATDLKFWGEVAEFSATLNLFNLAPVWQLDGSRGFHAMTRTQRWLVLAVIAATFAVTRHWPVAIVGAVALWRPFEKNVTEASDWRATATYAGLVVAFAAIATLEF